ncbi:hypothetical protein LAC79_32240 [Ensifer adhaerens]|uniref:hypothetical protein n=1 Tax=Ensifer adhaerens TaxID=106592 RepID=UPI001CBE26A6|nr:hypothetical protein [Ensifer adhaerens]MBZ7926445.1 hypothetical protein [Ensifer adhaerens]
MRALHLLAFCLCSSAVAAHDAPSGWSYPAACCSNLDCREVSATEIDERNRGFIVRATGELIPYSDRRLRRSPDGKYHRCSVNGSAHGRTICLFVPPRSF